MATALYSDWHIRMSEATCGEACWQAREDVCRCCCNGANHGCDRLTGERPERTKRKDMHRYKLTAITGYAEAWRMPRNDHSDYMGNVHPDAVYPSGAYFDASRRYPNERVIFNLASESAHKWPEVAAVDKCENGVKSYDCDTYLVWERIDALRTW